MWNALLLGTTEFDSYQSRSSYVLNIVNYIANIEFSYPKLLLQFQHDDEIANVCWSDLCCHGPHW